ACCSNAHRSFPVQTRTKNSAPPTWSLAMTSPSLTPASACQSTAGFGNRWLKNRVLRQLEHICHGHLLVHVDGESLSFGVPGATPHAELYVSDPALWSLPAGNGSIGAGEGYTHGYWNSP